MHSQKVLAIDWGERRLGLAVSDELGIAAHGLETLRRKNIAFDLDALAAVIRERSISTVIVGRPINMDGSPSRSSNLADRFARRLAKHAGTQVHMWDERLTSWEAQQLIGPRSRDRGATDRMAAVLLLESYLAARRS